MLHVILVVLFIVAIAFLALYVMSIAKEGTTDKSANTLTALIALALSLAAAVLMTN